MADVTELEAKQRAFRDLGFTRGDCPQLGDSPEAIWELFSTRYGPTVRAAASLEGGPRGRGSATSCVPRRLPAADGKVPRGHEYRITRAVRA